MAEVRVERFAPLHLGTGAVVGMDGGSVIVRYCALLCALMHFLCPVKQAEDVS